MTSSRETTPPKDTKEIPQQKVKKIENTLKRHIESLSDEDINDSNRKQEYERQQIKNIQKKLKQNTTSDTISSTNTLDSKILKRDTNDNITTNPTPIEEQTISILRIVDESRIKSAIENLSEEDTRYFRDDTVNYYKKSSNTDINNHEGFKRKRKTIFADELIKYGEAERDNPELDRNIYSSRFNKFHDNFKMTGSGNVTGLNTNEIEPFAKKWIKLGREGISSNKDIICLLEHSIKKASLDYALAENDYKITKYNYENAISGYPKESFDDADKTLHIAQERLTKVLSLLEPGKKSSSNKLNSSTYTAHQSSVENRESLLPQDEADFDI